MRDNIVRLCGAVCVTGFPVIDDGTETDIEIVTDTDMGDYD